MKYFQIGLHPVWISPSIEYHQQYEVLPFLITLSMEYSQYGGLPVWNSLSMSYHQYENGLWEVCSGKWEVSPQQIWAPLYNTALHCTVVCCIKHPCTVHYCIACIEQCSAVYMTLLQCSVAASWVAVTGASVQPAVNNPILRDTLHCTTLHCTALNYTVLHCNALYCTKLHCSLL